ncbi:hypothetical protein [Citrobacter portucalensis]|uniref:hypothetical protein n=1 Tax=Citrobacter portucalensis TaxID=1639133 RepID=UPI003890BD8E
MDNKFNTVITLLYFIFLFSYIVYLFKKKAFQMNAKPLTQQPLFKSALVIPFLSFLASGLICWRGHSLQIDADGFNNFLTISKFPLGLLSLSIPFGVIVNNIHRTIQTDKQIQEAQRKNSIDAYYAHRKNTMEMFEKITFNAFNTELNKFQLKIQNSFSLYLQCYPNASVNNNDFQVSESLIKAINSNFNRLQILINTPPENNYDDTSHWIWGAERILDAIHKLLKLEEFSNEKLYFKIYQLDSGTSKILRTKFSHEDEFKSAIRVYMEAYNSVAASLGISSSHSYLDDISHLQFYSHDLKNICKLWSFTHTCTATTFGVTASY